MTPERLAELRDAYGTPSKIFAGRHDAIDMCRSFGLDDLADRIEAECPGGCLVVFERGEPVRYMRVDGEE